MKILTTGGAGFIGSNIIKYFPKNYVTTLDSLSNDHSGYDRDL